MVTRNSAQGQRCGCGRGIYVRIKESTTRDSNGEIVKIEETYKCSQCGQTFTLTIYEKI